MRIKIPWYDLNTGLSITIVQQVSNVHIVRVSNNCTSV